MPRPEDSSRIALTVQPEAVIINAGFLALHVPLYEECQIHHDRNTEIGYTHLDAVEMKPHPYIIAFLFSCAVNITTDLTMSMKTSGEEFDLERSKRIWLVYN